MLILHPLKDECACFTQELQALRLESGTEFAHHEPDLFINGYTYGIADRQRTCMVSWSWKGIGAIIYPNSKNSIY